MTDTNYAPRWQAHLCTNEATETPLYQQPLDKAAFNKLSFREQMAEMKKRLAACPEFSAATETKLLRKSGT